MLFGVPPPNRDPELEGKYGDKTPRAALERFVSMVVIVTVLLAAYVVIRSIF